MQDIGIFIKQTRWHRQDREFLPWIHCGVDEKDISIGPNGD
jgi:hypothetical protein